jgi:5-(carboxyamino)imidazole ribonucleotide synthase
MKKEDSWPLYPPAFLGILGGGQLGRFFTQAAQDLGYAVCVLDPDPNSPAGQLAQKHIQANFDNEDALLEMASLCKAVSTEFENVPASTIDFLLEKGVFLAPESFAVSIAQNRIKEKNFLQHCQILMGIGPVDYAEIRQADDLLNIPHSLFPGILKTAKLGYDGKGQQKVFNLQDLQEAWQLLGQVECVLEQRLELAYELSVVIVRASDDEVHLLPIAQNIHQNGILHLSIIPSPAMSQEVEIKVQQAAKTIIRELHYVGVLCIEFFVLSDGKILVNEIAPRPHNSGHHSIDSCMSSQFDQQVRALAQLPLGNSALQRPVVMLNILGDVWFSDEGSDNIQSPPWADILKMPSARLHLYGKSEPKKGRKMGHINFLANSVEKALEDAKKAMDILGIHPENS